MVKLVRLEDEEGEVLEEVPASAAFLSDLPASQFPLLHYVDPWGDTVFNQQQAKAVSSEWGRLESTAKQQGQSDVWLAVKKLIEKSQSEPHLYVRFEGD